MVVEQPVIGPRLPSGSYNTTSLNDKESAVRPGLQSCSSIVVPVQASSVLPLAARWRTPQHMGAGLQNLGNTCYMNATLQCLAYSPPLGNLCLSPHSHSPTCSIAGCGPCAACLIEKQLCSMLRARRGQVISPYETAHHVKLFSKSFMRGRQEDSHEFLHGLLDAMERDLKRQNVQMGGSKDDLTYVEQLFQGRTRSEVRCLACGARSSSYEPFVSLSLDLPRGVGAPSSIIDCLKAFTKEEKLDGANLYKCDSCRRLQPAVKRLAIFDDPNILVVHLKRFDALMMGGKITRPIAFAAQLDLQPFLTDTLDMLASSSRGFLVPNGCSNGSGEHTNHTGPPGSISASGSANGLCAAGCSRANGQATNLSTPREKAAAAAAARSLQHSQAIPAFPSKDSVQRSLYSLTGVLVHQGGSVHSGHYYAYVCDHAGQWFCANDGNVSQVSWPKVESQSAYLLFYTRHKLKPIRPIPPVPAQSAAPAAQLPLPGSSGSGSAAPGPVVYGPDLPPAKRQRTDPPGVACQAEPKPVYGPQLPPGYKQHQQTEVDPQSQQSVVSGPTVAAGFKPQADNSLAAAGQQSQGPGQVSPDSAGRHATRSVQHIPSAAPNPLGVPTSNPLLPRMLSAKTTKGPNICRLPPQTSSHAGPGTPAQSSLPEAATLIPPGAQQGPCTSPPKFVAPTPPSADAAQNAPFTVPAGPVPHEIAAGNQEPSAAGLSNGHCLRRQEPAASQHKGTEPCESGNEVQPPPTKQQQPTPVTAELPTNRPKVGPQVASLDTKACADLHQRQGSRDDDTRQQERKHQRHKEASAYPERDRRDHIGKRSPSRHHRSRSRSRGHAPQADRWVSQSCRHRDSHSPRRRHSPSPDRRNHSHRRSRSRSPALRRRDDTRRSPDDRRHRSSLSHRRSVEPRSKYVHKEGSHRHARSRSQERRVRGYADRRSQSPHQPHSRHHRSSRSPTIYNQQLQRRTPERRHSSSSPQRSPQQVRGPQLQSSTTPPASPPSPAAHMQPSAQHADSRPGLNQDMRHSASAAAASEVVAPCLQNTAAATAPAVELRPTCTSHPSSSSTPNDSQPDLQGGAAIAASHPSGQLKLSGSGAHQTATQRKTFVPQGSKIACQPAHKTDPDPLAHKQPLAPPPKAACVLVPPQPPDMHALTARLPPVPWRHCSQQDVEQALRLRQGHAEFKVASNTLKSFLHSSLRADGWADKLAADIRNGMHKLLREGKTAAEALQQVLADDRLKASARSSVPPDVKKLALGLTKTLFDLGQ